MKGIRWVAKTQSRLVYVVRTWVKPVRSHIHLSLKEILTPGVIHLQDWHLRNLGSVSPSTLCPGHQTFLTLVLAPLLQWENERLQSSIMLKKKKIIMLNGKKMGVSVIQETLYLEKKERKTVDLGSLSYLKKWAGKKDEIAGPSQQIRAQDSHPSHIQRQSTLKSLSWIGDLTSSRASPLVPVHHTTGSFTDLTLMTLMRGGRITRISDNNTDDQSKPLHNANLGMV